MLSEDGDLRGDVRARLSRADGGGALRRSWIPVPRICVDRAVGGSGAQTEHDGSVEEEEETDDEERRDTRALRPHFRDLVSNCDDLIHGHSL